MTDRTPDTDTVSESTPESGPESVPGSAEDREFERLWAGLTSNQKKAAQQFLFESSVADTARAIGLEPRTLYGWGDEWREAAERLLDRRKDGIEQGIGALSPQAIDVLRRAVSKDGDEISRVEKESATYIIDRIAGRPKQKTEVSTTGGFDVSEDEAQELEGMLSHLDEEEGD